MLVDCHAHLDPFSDNELPEIIDRAEAAGVGVIISAGTTVESSQRSIELSARFPGFFSGVGIHPMDIREPFDDATAERGPGPLARPVADQRRRAQRGRRRGR